MIRRIDLRAQILSPRELSERLPRAALDVEAATAAVAPIVDDVRERGGAALRDLAERFDGVRPERLRVPASALEEAAGSLDSELREAFELSIAHNRAGHRAQMPAGQETRIVPGGVVRQRWIPVRRVGLYVPGGLAAYPSSVIMNAVAAQVAGVEAIALASPPRKDAGGLVHPTVLAVCRMLGIEEVYAVGGAQAVAMFAYGAAGEPGTPDPLRLCEPVDVVTGPGNVYVAAAKRAVRGVVGIDAEAGPTEIAIIADADADPDYIAADMVSQAEHDPAAASVLITDSTALADAVEGRMSERAARTKHSERVREALGGPQSGIVIVDTVGAAIDVANAYGPEHLEIHTRHVNRDAKRIRNAGAIFVGPYTPVPLGDYLAGSNHVLPTGGTARFASGLNVHSFLKAVQEIEYTKEAAAGLYEPLRRMSADEDLPAHAEALQARID
ncbi:histidinol dehydrogenase [Actinobaculum sp. oral taxon 183 str. F0552]|jgi:histidinol dehydrogenase|uniref:histidinol dehydrogenase n=1 Tax=Actinobaculum sp. oral taxon 183 TaxID=712888 RepID=UPI0003970975|nr:histidinol dehydrogenase [Actinobaculum sp. oral taxon 183]ERH16243.1 histidinol dehydrogenase [Actinobaculum sp. oral taxon 183 str. F0552]RKV67307.1 MAG: histidinol dehydrogenase [Actinomyces sp.]